MVGHLPAGALLRDSGDVFALPFGARISWLSLALLRLPERGGALPPDAVAAFDVGGVAFLPEDLEGDSGVSYCGS